MADKEVAPLSEQRLQEIRERAEKAANAPWKVATSDEWGSDWPITTGQSSKDGKVYHVCTDGVRGSQLHGDAQTDAEFIAAARTDIPDLLAELTRSRAALLKETERAQREHERVTQARAALLEVERQRTELGVAFNQEHAKLLDAEQKLAEQRWIPVSEKLPENEGRYLVTYRYKQLPPRLYVGDYSPKFGWDAVPAHNAITHWMAAPEPAAPSVEREG